VPDVSSIHTSGEVARSSTRINDFVSSSEGLRLVQSFMRIENADLRRRIVGLVEEISSDHSNLGLRVRRA
jgi:hypothetical protein